MSSRDEGSSKREDVLRRLGDAGRAMSDAAVLFHTRAGARFGLGVTDWKALGIIELSQPMTHRDLVDRLGLKPASVTNILDRLEKQDWIQRTKSESDARRISISVNQEKLARYRWQIFGPMMEKLGEVYNTYSTEELLLIARALEEIARAQEEAAKELQE